MGPLLYFTGNSWSTFPAYVVEELLCGSQPTAATCVVWSWRLIDCFALISTVTGFLRRGFSPFINPTAVPRWCASIRAKKISVAATAPEIFARWHLAIAITSIIYRRLNLNN